MNHLEKRKDRWYAVLNVPPDVQASIGKVRFVQSTKTGDRRLAMGRAAALVTEWKKGIDKARGLLPDPKATFWDSLRRDYLGTDDEGTQLAIEDIAAAAISKAPGTPEEASQRWLHVTGQATPLGPLVTAWKASLRHAQKTIDQQHRDVLRMSERLVSLEALTPQGVKVWTDELIASGTTASSLDRIGQGCRSFWGYLQQSGTKGMLDLDPFAGPFKLARKVAVRNTTGRSGSSYTPDQLAGLYLAAKEKGDGALADLIALGAYTGARIEELCKLTKETARDGVFSIGKSKTKAGIRECPIHPAVAPLVARMLEASTDGYLVPSTAENQYGNRSGPLGQRFGHLKESRGFGPSHVFHSTRNTLSTMMERAGVPEGIAADIVGHDKKTMTYGLYSSGTASAQKLDAISRVIFPAPLDRP